MFTEILTLNNTSYPDNNCAHAFPNGGFGDPKDPQAVFANYLNHTSGIAMMQGYLNSAALAKQAGKPLLMFETNTASCGGFPGVSDSFGAALWATDYGLQLAYGGFSGALLHVGGRSESYNVSDLITVTMPISDESHLLSRLPVSHTHHIVLQVVDYLSSASWK